MPHQPRLAVVPAVHDPGCAQCAARLLPRIAVATFGLLAVLSGLASAPACAEAYRWVDEDGHVQYSDQPPPGVTAERLEVHGESVSGDLEERQERREKLLDVMEQERAEDARADTEKAKQDEQRRQNCSTATDRLRQIEEARYIFERSADPDNPRVLEDGERAAYTERARQDVAKWCH